jgi:hypothetical protein
MFGEEAAVIEEASDDLRPVEPAEQGAYRAPSFGFRKVITAIGRIR